MATITLSFLHRRRVLVPLSLENSSILVYHRAKNAERDRCHALLTYAKLQIAAQLLTYLFANVKGKVFGDRGGA